jgi:hypothetical protein
VIFFLKESLVTFAGSLGSSRRSGSVMRNSVARHVAANAALTVSSRRRDRPDIGGIMMNSIRLVG